MPSDIVLDSEFAEWLRTLAVDERSEVMGSIELLRSGGPNLGRPYVDRVNGSDYQNMKELRIQIAGKPWRILFAFDPNRAAVLLAGGNKGGDSRWYKSHVPIADRRFGRHLDTLKE